MTDHRIPFAGASQSVTVAIPVRDGATVLDQTLSSVCNQTLHTSASVELLVCDSGSTDRSIEIARSYGAKVIEIPSEAFSHGGTRNLLMQHAEGTHVAFLSQDAVPADEGWLERILSGFALAEDVALAFGPYLPRPDANPAVARELTAWFHSLSPDGSPQVDRLLPDERDVPAEGLLGRLGFFTDANGCVLRDAWQSVPFRPVPYAEDHVLAHDMLRAGFAKAYVPDASVIHSHDYSGWDWLRRSFDEARAMHEVYGFSEPGELRRAALMAWGSLGADLRWARRDAAAQLSHGRTAALLVRLLKDRALRAAGTMLGTRARRLPDTLTRRLSLEKRSR